ncbi:hypothetical protein SAMD00023353_0103910 [Rosellinia necatrix]|uniref:Uncharacterized protein n=1 Tax=Rosellinia necatrix TaxID=77044 RepID=A0A1S8A5D0_ROSNE|nr:hypothetical protein SAMD00023353_0103910 [Rosellinia necatrix]
MATSSATASYTTGAPPMAPDLRQRVCEEHCPLQDITSEGARAGAWHFPGPSVSS